MNKWKHARSLSVDMNAKKVIKPGVCMLDLGVILGLVKKNIFN